MAEIGISAVLTDGAAVLFEVLGPSTDGPTPRVALPGYVLSDGDDSIEAALAAGVLADLSVEVITQEFVETLYERTPESQELRLNNLQLVSAWEGTVLERSANGRELLWVPIEALPALALPADLKTQLLGTFGLATGRSALAGAAAAPGRVIVVTGPAGAGQSNVAAAVAQALPTCAVVPLDDLRQMTVSGAPLPHWEGGDFEASFRHGLLALRNAAALARNFSDAGYDVVIEGMFEQPQELDELLAALSGTGIEAYFVTLQPALDAVLGGDGGRTADQHMGGRSREHFGLLGSNGEYRGLRIDSAQMSVAEAAAVLLDRLADARVQ